MLWSKKKPKPTTEPREAPASEPPVLGTSDKAFDVLLTLVRLYGKHAFDTDLNDAGDVETMCNDWATRLSLGAARTAEAEPGVAGQ